jgi:NitT/TauT family transport system substrate-binding protein
VTRAFLDANPGTVEGFGRALVRGTKFGLDPANREATLKHVAVGNPQESEDPDFAGALLTAIQGRTLPVDSKDPFGYMPPGAWVKWQESLVASGGLEKPLDNLEAAYTNQFVEAWNAAK